MHSTAEERMKKWLVQSPEDEGLHPCIVPGAQDCRAVYVYRLNIAGGSSFTLRSGELEMNAILISGRAGISGAGLQADAGSLDALYIPGGCTVELSAAEDCVFYIGAARCEGYGKPFFRTFEKDLPYGDIHQCHGAGVAAREVYFTLGPQDAGSRLLCGITFSQVGAWTSWPPHQHEKDLEEAYCYFDMPAPQFGFHISYLKSGEVDDIVTHVVHSGSFVLAPVGYHPTVASPANRNSYIWIMAAHSHESRRYDLAVNDPCFS